jgi:hypothetical protein
MNYRLILLSTATLLAVGSLSYAAEPDDRAKPDARQQLNRTLNDQTNQAYPDREQVEQRRKLMRERMREKLQRADQNGDGSISRAAAERDLPGMARHFDLIDTNHDGIISREELRAAREKMREMREQRINRDSNKASPPPQRQ